MPTTKQLTADILFLAQIGLALVFGGSEFLRLLNTSQGIPIFWLASWLAFLLINLVLTIRAYVSYPSRVTLQAVGCYALWTVIIASDLVVLFLKGTDIWRAADTITAIIVAAGIMVIILWGHRRGHGLGGPIVHGYLGILFIGIPQITLACTIFQEGGQGLAGAALAGQQFFHPYPAGALRFCHCRGRLGPEPERRGHERIRQRNKLAAGHPGLVDPLPSWLRRRQPLHLIRF